MVDPRFVELLTKELTEELTLDEKQELEQLLKARENNEIDTKYYLLKKKEIKDQIFSYDYFLKETKFENW